MIWTHVRFVSGFQDTSNPGTLTPDLVPDLFSHLRTNGVQCGWKVWDVWRFEPNKRVFIITYKTKVRRGWSRRCRCYERRRDKVRVYWSLSHTRWIGGSQQGRGRGDGVDATLMSNTLKYISLPDVDIIWHVGFRYPMHLCALMDEWVGVFEPLDEAFKPSGRVINVCLFSSE